MKIAGQCYPSLVLFYVSGLRCLLENDDLVELHPCYNKFSSCIDQCKQDVQKSATVSRER